MIYGKRIHITGCDRFTRWFFEENGIDLGPEEQPPTDTWYKNYTFTQAAAKGEFGLARNVVEDKKRNECMIGGGQTNPKLEQFMANDRKVLRFQGYWDDHTLYGMRMYFILHYYLSDNSIEINEMHARNSG